MWRMTRDAAVGLNRSMFVNERSLLVCVTLDASCIYTCRQSCLFQFKTAMWVVAIAALHRAFQHLVMEWQIELVLGFTVATEAKLRFTIFQQLQIRETRLLRVCFGNEDIGRRELPSLWLRMRRMAVSTTNVVAPMLAAAKVVVFFLARVTP